MKNLFTFLVFLFILVINNPSFADFPIRQSSNWDGFNAIAYNSTDHEYLVVWTELVYLGGPIKGQRVGENGDLLGSAFTCIQV